MKRRVLAHHNRCEVEQYYKLLKRYKTFEEDANGLNLATKPEYLANGIPYSELNRRAKSLDSFYHKKKFRSALKAVNFSRKEDEIFKVKYC